MIVAALVVLTDWRPVTCVLVGWDVGVALYLVLAAHLISGSDVRRIRERAALEDEGKLAILALTVSAALASLGAIVAELGSTGAARRPPHVALAALTIMLSWAFIHTIFALHYAHEFYDETAGGMSFPGGDPEPDYLGLHLLLVRDRDDVPGLRRRRHQPRHSAHGERPRRRLLRLQRRAARLEREHRGERHLTAAA